MPIQADFPLVTFADGLLTVQMKPQQNISNWSVRVQVFNRFGSNSGLITKSMASGFGGGQSGITVTNSGQGIFTTQIWQVDKSGFASKNYYYSVLRLDSGFNNTLAEGFLPLTP